MHPSSSIKLNAIERAADIGLIFSMTDWQRKMNLNPGHDQSFSLSDSGNSNRPPNKCFLSDGLTQTRKRVPHQKTMTQAYLDERVIIPFLSVCHFYEGILIRWWKSEIRGIETVIVQVK